MRLSCHALEIIGSQWNYRVHAVNRGYRSQIPDILNITLYVQPWIASYYSLQHTVTQQRRLTQTRGEKWSTRSCKAAKQTSDQLVKQSDRLSCTAAGGPHLHLMQHTDSLGHKLRTRWWRLQRTNPNPREEALDEKRENVLRVDLWRDADCVSCIDDDGLWVHSFSSIIYLRTCFVHSVGKSVMCLSAPCQSWLGVI